MCFSFEIGKSGFYEYLYVLQLYFHIPFILTGQLCLDPPLLRGTQCEARRRVSELNRQRAFVAGFGRTAKALSFHKKEQIYRF
jgi:hypothetical protein